MAVKKANVLNDQQLSKLLKMVTLDAQYPVVDTVVYLLSYKAGLRAQEIAGLRWANNVLDSDGKIMTRVYEVAGSKGRIKKQVLPELFIGSDIGKYGSERTLRMHPMLYDAMIELQKAAFPGPFVIPSMKNGASTDLKCRAHALTMRINRFYAKMGYQNTSSHSGRRSFITDLARKANFAGASIVDVQKMAGHRQLTTTQEYVASSSAQADLIGLI